MPLTSGTPTWQKVATFVLLVAIFGAVVFVIVRTGSTNAAVNATRSSVERTDCARKVNAEQSAARDAATLADRAVNRYYFKVALNATVTREPVIQQQIDDFTKLIETADAADKAVADLPDPALEVERRCPS